MKSAYKYELANAAGVTDRTFRRWLGVTRTTKLLPPKAVEWICKEYGIDFPEAA